MSAALVADIITRWVADSTLSAVAGPYLGLAGDEEAYPYAVYQFVGDGRDEYFFDRTLVEEPHARFTIYHTDLAALLTYYRAMDDLLLQNELGASTGTTDDRFVRCTKLTGSRIVNARSRPAGDGKTVYFATGAYAFKTQRTLPTPSPE